MSHVQVLLASWAGVLATVAVFAGWRERRRSNRSRMDAVGMIPWPTVQMLAFLGLAVCGLLALHAG